MNALYFACLLCLFNTHQLCASQDHPLLPETHDAVAKADQAGSRIGTPQLESILNTTDPSVFASNNGFIVFYNICNTLAGFYAETPKDPQARQFLIIVYNRLMDHPMRTEQTLRRIDPDAQDRLTVPITATYAADDFTSFVNHLTFLGHFVKEDPFTLFHAMLSDTRNKHFDNHQRNLTFSNNLLAGLGRGSFETMTPDDHWYLSIVLTKANKPALEVYRHRKYAFPCAPDREKNLCEVLSLDAFKLGFYEDAINFGTRFQILNEGYLDPEAVLELAQSSFYTGDVERAKAYFIEFINAPHLSVLLITPEILMMILDCLGLEIPPAIQKSIINLADPVISPASQNPVKPKKKKRNFEETREKIIRAYVQKIKGDAIKIRETISKIPVERLRTMWTSTEGFPAIQDLIDSASTLTTEMQDLETRSPEDVVAIRHLFGRIQTLQQAISEREKEIKDQIAADMRARLASAEPKPASSSATLSEVTAGLNLRAEVLAAHAAVHEKVKTTGTQGAASASSSAEPADVAAVTPPLVRGMIKSSSADVAGLLSGTAMIDGLPANARELLLILDTCENLRALTDRLTPGADLKPLPGNPHHTYQVKINDQYRVRFNIASDGQGFCDVNIRDFH